MTFKNDLYLGQKFEKECEMYLDGQFEYAPNKKFKPYDFKIGDTKYEVKSDRLAYKTGNICIEYECNNKPSGIITTESDYYIYFIINKDKNDCYKIPTSIIREKIKNQKSIRGGDGFRSMMTLLKISDFREYLINPILKII